MKDILSKIIKHKLFVPVSVGAGSFGAGVAIGYFIGRRSSWKLIEKDYDASLDFEVREVIQEAEKQVVIDREALDESDIREPVIIDEEVYEKGRSFVESVTGQLGIADDIPAPPEEPQPDNVFAGSDDDWNYPAEMAKRTPFAPYILHKDEFYAEELDFHQSTLTYYAGDNIVVDEENSPVYNHVDVIGELRFGHGSGDPNVVYVRNEKNRAEYEVIQDPGLYSVEVLGLEIENNQRAKDLKHGQVLKFRSD